MSFDNSLRDSFGRLEGDAGLNVSFSADAVRDDEASEATGIETFRDEVFITIVPPGNPFLRIHTIATAQHKRRFPREWEAFSQGQRLELVGTPLSEWPQITTSQVRNLAAQNIYTVEQLASMSDGLTTRLGMSTLKVKAQVFLEAQKGQASLSRQAEALAARDREIEAMKREIELMRQIQQAAPVAPVETPSPAPAKKKGE